MDITEIVLRQARQSTEFEAPIQARMGLIANAFGEGGLSPEKVSPVIEGLSGEPCWFWRLAATAAVNMRDPLVDRIITSLEEFASARGQEPHRETARLLRRELSSSVQP